MSLILFLGISVAGQNMAVEETWQKNSLNFELGGVGLIYSLGYERQLIKAEKTSHSVKIGVSYPLVDGFNYLLVPVEYNYYLGSGKNKLMLGLGLVNLIGTLPSPAGLAAQGDFRHLYNANPYSATSKYNTEFFNSSYDVGLTGKIGYIHSMQKVNLYAYYNCFYIRFTYKYWFQPIWFGAGIARKF